MWNRFHLRMPVTWLAPTCALPCSLAVAVLIISWPTLGNAQGLSDHRSAASGQTTQGQLPQSANDEPIGYKNWAIKTLGGNQFWTDVRYVGGWRVQQNSETGHFRLLDPKDVRQAWGNRAHCDQSLDQFIAQGTAGPLTGKVVIVLHGLIRTSDSMQPLADYLEASDYRVVNFRYASTRKGLGDHAAALKSVIDGLGPTVTEIYFVGHSLGNLVVRRYLGDQTDPATGQQGDRRIKRMVMIGPPNQGSRMARLLKSSLLFNSIAGVSGAELSRKWDQVAPTLATPHFEFGIIAGGQADGAQLDNFILRGKDDFTVGLGEAKLVGAADLLVRPLLHSTMMRQPEVMEATLKFFQQGCFVSPQTRNPISASGDNLE